MTPGRLAKELGVPRLDLWHAMQELRINAKRMDARLSDRQVGALRTYYNNKQRARARRAAQAVVGHRPSSVAPIPAAREFPRTCPCCDRRWIHRGIEGRTVARAAGGSVSRGGQRDACATSLG
jgi:hypothetical protein